MQRIILGRIGNGEVYRGLFFVGLEIVKYAEDYS